MQARSWVYLRDCIITSNMRIKSAFNFTSHTYYMYVISEIGVEDLWLYSSWSQHSFHVECKDYIINLKVDRISISVINWKCGCFSFSFERILHKNVLQTLTYSTLLQRLLIRQFGIVLNTYLPAGMSPSPKVFSYYAYCDIPFNQNNN